jgi:GNAT superfamily N-acetyltransferase
MTGATSRETGETREVWARGRGVTLLPLDRGAPLAEGLAQALRDGIERGYEGDTPGLPPDARSFTIEVRGVPVGLLAFRLDWPEPQAATVVALAIDPAERGHSYAARALFTAERALAADIERWYATVPRTNGRGLYFMLRCGYAPLLEVPSGAVIDGSTWFARATGLQA